MKKPDKKAWFQGGAAVCANPPDPPIGAPWRLVLLGAPGVGKGAQATLLCERLGACHLSTGEMLRAAGCQGSPVRSPALRTALANMRKGALVPDDIMLELVSLRRHCLRCSGGFVLDGFPRTVAQAEALDALLGREGLALDAVFDYELPVEEIVARLAGRRICAGCGAVYHVTGRPPQRSGICDACGKRLVQREDDRPEAIHERMRLYGENTQPLLDWYSRKGLLVTVPANGTPDEVYARTWISGRTMRAAAATNGG
jgi:adenylate kinase